MTWQQPIKKGFVRTEYFDSFPSVYVTHYFPILRYEISPIALTFYAIILSSPSPLPESIHSALECCRNRLAAETQHLLGCSGKPGEFAFFPLFTWTQWGTQLGWVSRIHTDCKIVLCLGPWLLSESVCLSVLRLCPRQAFHWSQTLLMRVLGFQSGGAQPPPARLSGELSALAQKCSSLENWFQLPLEGVSKFLRHNIFVTTVC